MTDREPDDLYDALRDRLADYGQEPPAPLWSGIRAQLPPPVAQSKLRRRRRAGLLALLLLVVSVGSWQWWQMGRKNGSSEAELAAANHMKSDNQTASRRPANTTEKTYTATNEIDAAATRNAIAHNANTSTQSSAATTEKSAAVETAGVPNAVVAVVATSKTSEIIAASTATSTPGASSKHEAARLALRHKAGKTIAATGKGVTGLAAGSSLATASSTIVSSRKAGKAVVTSGAAVDHSMAARNQSRATTHRKSAHYAATRQPNGPAEQPGKVVLLAGNAAKKPFIGRKPGHSNASETFATVSHTLAAAAASTALQSADEAKSAAEKTSTQLARSAADGQAPTSASHSTKASTASAVALSQPTPIDEPTAASSDSFVAWSRLQPRPVALALLPWATPAVNALADTFPHLPSAVARRWAVQVLAGPALTYRQLGSEGLMAATPTPATNYVNYNGDATSVVQQERPALGFGAQVQLRRALNGRWALSAGLGYQEYATSLAFQTVEGLTGASPISSAPHAPDSSTTTTSFHLRNTYRLLTVPVRFSYQLGVGGPRFRLGLLAGAEAALYLGAATAETSSCGCQTQTWGRTGSPYRSLNLALNLGLDLRYRLAPRWELLAQPMATGFLTSLARSGSGLTPRYLVGAGAMLGISYGLK